MTGQGEQNQEELRQLVHDVLNCLHVIGIGTELLKGARGDDRKFAEICESIDGERKEAAKLVGQFLAAAGKRGS